MELNSNGAKKSLYITTVHIKKKSIYDLNTKKGSVLVRRQVLKKP